jgi:hypothetical protein
LAFSLEGYHGFAIFETLIDKYARNAWLGWIGSVFLETFDTLIEEMYRDEEIQNDEAREEFDIEWDTFNFTVGGKKKPTSTFRKRSKQDFISVRKNYENRNQVLYLQKVTYKVISRDAVLLQISLSDNTEFTLERGSIHVFLSLLRDILRKAQQERDLFTRTSSIRKHEDRRGTSDEPIEMISFEIDKIELLEVDVSNLTSKSWFQNLRTTFSTGYLREHNLISAVINDGNPYFLAKVIDLENTSRVFISATSKSIRISPAAGQTKPSTVSKLFTILQSQVDPSIGTAELNAA